MHPLFSIISSQSGFIEMDLLQKMFLLVGHEKNVIHSKLVSNPFKKGKLQYLSAGVMHNILAQLQLKSRKIKKNNKQILPSSLSSDVIIFLILNNSLRGRPSAKRSMIVSLSRAFNLAGCKAIRARLHILDSVMVVRVALNSRFRWLKLRSPSFDVIGYVSKISKRISVSLNMLFG